MSIGGDRSEAVRLALVAAARQRLQAHLDEEAVAPTAGDPAECALAEVRRLAQRLRERSG